ncbi:hypothetical protein [Virgibacillus sp. YIM 98842]|nr:hypothetical protein [Virgibacillus sp. YIM 98842]
MKKVLQSIAGSSGGWSTFFSPLKEEGVIRSASNWMWANANTVF